ncbi:MAG: SAM-dependent methyltransferase, partial [Bacteroidales bacterium]|nr:SAM-dependent methyltransferase [Bacteroidales bacterium]
IDRLEKVIVKSGYNIDARMYWFINPNYEIKFKLKPRRQSRLIAAIPYLRNFFTTAGYYIVGRKHA